MNPIDFLERRFGRFAIPGLVRVIVALNALVYLLSLWSPSLLSWLNLDPEAILQGQVWRLVTYLFIPNYGSIFTALFNQPGNALDTVFSLLFLWWIGDSLEQVWGAFRLNLFYLIGMAGTTLAAFLFGANFSNGMLNLSLFFAFAWFFPNVQIYFFFILPIMMKWLAWFFAAMLLWQAVVFGSLSYRMALVASMANFLLFFGPEIVARARQRHQVSNRRQTFARASVSEEEPLHRCVVCQRTDLSHPDLEFRVARDGNDYCMEHLPSRSHELLL
jgi:membrane associated rhomboid family serine protease